MVWQPNVDTKRTEIGESLYQLKYRRNPKTLAAIVEVANTFMKRWKPKLDDRTGPGHELSQPVILIAGTGQTTEATRPPASFGRGISQELKDV